MNTTENKIIMENNIEILLLDNKNNSNCVEILTAKNSHLHTQLRISKYFLDPDGVFTEKEARVVSDIILHHVTEEDRALIPKIQLQVTSEDLKRMGENYIKGMSEEIFSQVS